MSSEFCIHSWLSTSLIEILLSGHSSTIFKNKSFKESLILTYFSNAWKYFSGYSLSFLYHPKFLLASTKGSLPFTIIKSMTPKENTSAFVALYPWKSESSGAIYPCVPQTRLWSFSCFILLLQVSYSVLLIFE